MKKTLMALTLLVFLGSACKTTKVSNSSEAEKYVTKFLSYMDQKDGPKRQEMMDCISPSYISENNIKTSDYKVNNYSIWGFSIESYDASTGIVVTRVWGEARKWVHELDFKVVKEKGSLYLMPSKHSDAYIDPWFEAKTYIKD
ncbi:MAG: hypothetical protein WCL06_13855 [Bacteroidota bacterium]